MTGLVLTGFLIGVLGSVHCATMCGPIALTLRSKGKFGHLLFYNTGRMVSYVLLGVSFGVVGQGLSFFGLQQVLSILMGVWVIVMTALPHFQSRLLQTPIHKKIIKPLRLRLKLSLESNKVLTYTITGVLNGLLPCGLSYMAFSFALATGSVAHSILLMSGFGLGTTPMLLGIASAFGLLKKQAYSFRYIIPGMALVMGTLLILRGMALDIPYVSPVLSATGLDLGIPTCGGNPL